MKPRVRKILILVLAAVLAVSAVGMIHDMTVYRQGEETYAEAEALAGLPDLDSLPAPTAAVPPEQAAPPSASAPVQPADPAATPAPSATPVPVYVDPYAEALREMDFTALREVNSDVLGWILLPGTGISYPLLQCGDNDYYLNHTWRRTRSAVGAIFLEHQNSSDFSDFNTLIYGHRMRNNSMFGILHRFKSQSYWSAHPCVYITTGSGTTRYEIFAAYEVSTQGDTYRLGFSGDQAKQSFIDYCLAQSAIDTGLTPHTYDKIITLSTCTGSGHATRWVVQAVAWGTPPPEPAPTPVPTPAPDASAGEAPPAGPAEETPPASPAPEEDGQAGPEPSAEPVPTAPPQATDAPAASPAPEPEPDPAEPPAPDPVPDAPAPGGETPPAP